MNAATKRPTSRLTDRDLDLLAFASEHRIITAEHARRFLGSSASVAYTRLRALTSAGMLERDFGLHGQPGLYLATAKGLRAAGRSYRPLRADVGSFQHDLGVAWLWLAARVGTFGGVRDVISERSLRSHDLSPHRAGEPFGVRLGGIGPGGRERLHYPDLMLITPGGRRIAFELELTAKGIDRRDRILMGYAVDRRLDAVVYLVQNRAVGRRIQASARRLGISNLVHVQLVTGLERRRGQGRGLTRSAHRAPAR